MWHGRRATDYCACDLKNGGNVPTFSLEQFEAELWPTLRNAELATSNRDDFATHWFVFKLGGQWGLKTGGDAAPEFHILAYEFLWEAVRCGILIPTSITGHAVSPPFSACKFSFTVFGKHWRERGEDTVNPFADDFEASILHIAPDFEGEPITLLTEARRAHKAGLRRASMFLLGLMNEDLLSSLFDVGFQAGTVTSKATLRQPGKAWAMQEDVHDALARAEPNVLAKGFAAGWSSLVGSLRESRNQCAHEANYQPSAHEIYSALFMLPRLAKLTHAAHVVLKGALGHQPI